MSDRILVVEDEPKIASVLSDYLRASGLESFCLETGLFLVATSA